MGRDNVVNIAFLKPFRCDTIIVLKLFKFSVCLKSKLHITDVDGCEFLNLFADLMGVRLLTC